MLLTEIFDPRSIKLNLESKTKETVLAELIDAIVETHPDYNRQELFTLIMDREHKMSTGIASGIAIPHAFYGGVDAIAGAIGISQTGIDYNALDHKPVYVVFLLVMGESGRENHLRVLNRIFALAQSEAFTHILKAKNMQDLLDILAQVH